MLKIILKFVIVFIIVNSYCIINAMRIYGKITLEVTIYFTQDETNDFVRPFLTFAVNSYLR